MPLWIVAGIFKGSSLGKAIYLQISWKYDSIINSLSIYNLEANLDKALLRKKVERLRKGSSNNNPFLFCLPTDAGTLQLGRH